jgi:hypothetical protein
MARHVYNLFVRVFIYVLPFWLAGFEYTVHQSLKERNPEAFLAPALMLSAIALLTPLCFARKAPHRREAWLVRLKYRCDIVLIAVAAALALFGMPLWHQMLGVSLGATFEGWPTLALRGWTVVKSDSVVYYFWAVGLSELKRLTT